MISTRLRVKELLRERRWTTKVLAEKTGMSESYLTHIKNGTRRWNEDALKKLAGAFELEPTDIFADRKSVTGYGIGSSEAVVVSDEAQVPVSVRVVPIVGEIPSQPSEYNNKLTQVATGYKDQFVPAVGSDDKALFCLCLEDNSYAPQFVKGDYLIISPELWTRSGDIVAVEYGNKDEPIKMVAQVNYSNDLVVFESVNHKKPPVALVKGKDTFRIIGKVMYRYQKMA